MPKNPDFEQDLRIYGKGARPDADKEMLPQIDPGLYYDAFDMRPDGESGAKGSIEKAGYVNLVQDPESGGDTNFYSMGSEVVNGLKVEFYAHTSASSDPRIYVDGVKVAQHADIPIVYGENFQLDKNENCLGGEIFVFSATEPIILNIQDMVDSVALDKYFGDFNLELYSINVFKPLDIPIFREIIDLGAGGGNPLGSYRYSMRYVTDDPDNADEIVAFSQWSPYTPYIHIPKHVDSDDINYIYPRNATVGGLADSQVRTNYGIKIRFRITNILDFGILEIKRQRSIDGDSAEITPPEDLIARLPIGPGDIGIQEFVDPFDVTDEEVLAPQDAIEQQLSFISSAKTGRYFKKRLILMNVTSASRDDVITYTESNGEKIYPVVKKIGRQGMKNPYNQVYFKPIMHGERFNFGGVLFDGVGGQGFVREHNDLKNYQIPNRREPASANTIAVSPDMPTAARTDHTIGKCHEIFDTIGSEYRQDKCSFKNIYDFDQISVGQSTYGRKTVATNTHANVGFPPHCSTSTPFPNTTITSLNRVQPDYLPFYPKESGHEEWLGLNFNINPQTYRNTVTKVSFSPKVFGPNFYSTGIAINGIENIPSWTRAISIVRSAPAGRVVAQGIAMYKMEQGDLNTFGVDKLAKKKVDEFWFHCPDFLQQFVASSVVDDMKTNPDNYKVQFITPLGFTSEIFGFENVTGGNNDRIVDMLTHANVLFDNGDINNSEFAGMGISNYVAFGKYRNSVQNAAFLTASGGNLEFGLSSFGSLTDGRGSFYEMKVKLTNGVPVAIYNETGTGVTTGSGDAHFDDGGVKDFQEPFYMVNIIQDKNVPDRTINEYVATGHYQKIESIIGAGDNTSSQTLELVDERWEDCIPALASTDANASDDFYLQVQDANKNKEIWINVTYKNNTLRTTINDDIQQNGSYDPGDGTVVKGMYTHTSSTNLRDHTIVFNQYSYFPITDALITVHYDNRRPILVFGGNVSIGHSMFAPLDRTADGGSSDKSNQFQMGMGFPYNKYEVNARHYIIRHSKTAINRIQDVVAASTGYIRQWIMMYLLEAQTPLHLAHGDNHYPQVNYIVRPNKFDPGGATSNNIFSEYLDDFGEGEDDIWEKGGFRFLPLYNVDYSKDPPVQYFSKPAVGFTEQTEWCSRAQFSFPRQTNQQDSPSLKAFLSSNYVDLDDDQGEIVVAWDATSGGKGENLYAITTKGICLIITEKAILSDLNSDEIGMFAQEGFILGQYWLDKTIGIPSGFERSAIKESVGFKTEEGKVRREALIFANKNSVYRLSDNTLKDVLADKYASILRPVLDTVLAGYATIMSSGYDLQHDEYYLTIGQVSTFVFNQDVGEWVGRFSFYFNSYMNDGRYTYGSFGLQTYKINDGSTAFSTANPPVSWVIQVSSMDFSKGKMFPAIKVNSNYVPTKIEILEVDKDNPTQFTVIGTILAADMRDYKGFEQDVPRRSDTGDLVDERVLIYKIHHTGVTPGTPSVVVDSKFRITSSTVSNKKIS